MSELIKHECGIAMVRLKKPLAYYQEKYGTWMYGLRKLYLLMEKQHNRGQDGAGIVSIKLNMPPGNNFFNRVRSNASQPIKEVFDKINNEQERINELHPDWLKDPDWAKMNLPFAAEIMLGHLRYGTFGKNDIENVHPVMRENNWISRNLVLAGNFNMTNVDELFDALVELGQNPRRYTDTVTVLENVGHFLDEENQGLYELFKKRGYSKKEISPLIHENLDVQSVLSSSSKRWDGGYVIAGIIGHGDSFVMRDPWGIRPAFFYEDNEIVIAASERPVIQTVMNLKATQINELPPGYALIIKKNGQTDLKQVRQPEKKLSCSFERIYFSRGGDKDIYRERKRLGELLTPQIVQALEGDIDNAVFSFIPNTAESAFLGMVKGIEDYHNSDKTKQIMALGPDFTAEQLQQIINRKARVEKIAIKDIKLRTFISEDKGRDDLVQHVYDVTYGAVRNNLDSLVVIDDSIVRGTTLRQSIIRILDRLNPKQIIIVSSSPQIRYPDCYGIDMAKIDDFVAFRAAIALLKETNQAHIIDEVYQKSKAQEVLPKEEVVNYVKEIYAPFSAEQISLKIAELVTHPEVNAPVKVIYQTVENLHHACPNDLGDWYFTGNYPTPGGNKVVNKAYINFIEGKKDRAY